MNNIIPKNQRFCTYNRSIVLDVRNMKEDFLPLYNKELVEKIQKEQEDLKEYILEYSTLIENYNDEQDSLQPENNASQVIEKKKDEVLLLYKVLISYFERNQKALMIYTFHRIKRIKEFYWKYGCIPEGMVEHMTQSEIRSFNEYKVLVENTLEGKCDVRNLGSGKPPVCDLFETESVLKNIGLVESLSGGGSFYLKKGSIMNIKGSEGRDFIRQGHSRKVNI